MFKGFKRMRMDVLLCQNCGEIDPYDGNTKMRGKCWHCGNVYEPEKKGDVKDDE